MIFFLATRCRAQLCIRGSLHFGQRPDELPGIERYPAVLSFATSLAVEDSCGEGGSVADNFLQKQRIQRGPSRKGLVERQDPFEKRWSCNPAGPRAGRALQPQGELWL